LGGFLDQPLKPSIAIAIKGIEGSRRGHLAGAKEPRGPIYARVEARVDKDFAKMESRKTEP